MAETAKQGHEFGPLLLLTPAELRDFSRQLSEITSSDVIEMDDVRELAANWTATVRIRLHPRFQENTRAYQKALVTGEFYEGLTPEEADDLKPPW